MKKRIEDRREKPASAPEWLYALPPIFLLVAVLIGATAIVITGRKYDEFLSGIDRAHEYHSTKAYVRVCAGPEDDEHCTPWKDAKDAR